MAETIAQITFGESLKKYRDAVRRDVRGKASDTDRYGLEKDRARLDYVTENFEDINFDGWYDHFDFAAADAAEDGNEGHRVEHRKAWRKYLDAEMEGK